MQVTDAKYDSKMTHLNPVTFSADFSKTYADLLKNVKPSVPADPNHRSEMTESEYYSYPSPIFKNTQQIN